LDGQIALKSLIFANFFPIITLPTCQSTNQQHIMIISSHASVEIDRPTAAMIVSPHAFAQIAREMLQLPVGDKQYSEKRERREFRAAFGSSFETISTLWTRLRPKERISNRAKPHHLLWTFIYFKVHTSEPLMCKIAQCKSCDTFRNWVKKFTYATAALESEVIVWANRFINWDPKSPATVSVDGTDTWIQEPWPRSRIWWSHKLNHAGLRYEICCCIQTGDIVSINGPFPGNMSDREIFDLGLSLQLMPGELVEADNGYNGRVQIQTAAQGPDRASKRQKSKVRGRQENVNRRLKVFKVMEKFQSTDVAKHAKIARAVAVIVQLSFENGDRLYPVEYNVKYDTTSYTVQHDSL